jgi:hypothetical protein
MLRGTSEVAHRFRFDTVSNRRMQAGGRHYIGCRSQYFADTILDVDQFNKAETRIVGVKEMLQKIKTFGPAVSGGPISSQLQGSAVDL